jgi:hypothetical protein
MPITAGRTSGSRGQLVGDGTVADGIGAGTEEDGVVVTVGGAEVGMVEADGTAGVVAFMAGTANIEQRMNLVL